MTKPYIFSGKMFFPCALISADEWCMLPRPETPPAVDPIGMVVGLGSRVRFIHEIQAEPIPEVLKAPQYRIRL